MKLKTKHTRVQVSFKNEKRLTDQSHAKELTMANIQKRLERGIMFPQASNAFYSTDLGIRNLQDLHERQKSIQDFYARLPLEIRDLMKHDVKNFDKVLFDPQNRDLLLSHGLLVEKDKEHKKLVSALTQSLSSLPGSATGATSESESGASPSPNPSKRVKNAP